MGILSARFSAYAVRRYCRGSGTNGLSPRPASFSRGTPAGPPPSRQALQVEPSIGLLLPCNVVIRRTGEVTVVEAINPEALVTLTENPAMTSLSHDLAAALNATLETLRDLA